MADLSRTTAPSRLDALDGLRGLAAVGIVVLHVWMFDYGDAGQGEKSLLDHAIGELRLGVPLFFLLSGYLLFRRYVSAALRGSPPPALRRYVLRRAARILPAYWLALAVAFVVLRVLDHPRAVDASELPLFLLFLQNYEPETLKQLNPPMWTLCVEVAFYAFLPVAGLVAVRWCSSRMRLAALCLGLIAVGAGLTAAAVYEDWPATATNTLPLHLASFAAGMLVAVVAAGRELSRRTGWLLIAAGVALVAFDGWWHSWQIGSQTLRSVVADLPAVAGFALIVAALVASPVRARALTARPVLFAGTLSYAMYLLHFPALDAVRALDRWPEQLGAALALVLALTVAASMVSWYVIERPALRWARRQTPPSRRRSSRDRGRAATAPARS